MVDVGRHAGVSMKTVSRVFNNEPNVSDESARRGARGGRGAELSSQRPRPGAGAASFPSDRPGLREPVAELCGRTADGRARTAARTNATGWWSYRSHRSPSANGEVVGLLRSAALDGVVLAPPASDNPRILDDLAAAGIRYARDRADPGARGRAEQPRRRRRRRARGGRASASVSVTATSPSSRATPPTRRASMRMKGYASRPSKRAGLPLAPGSRRAGAVHPGQRPRRGPAACSIVPQPADGHPRPERRHGGGRPDGGARAGLSVPDDLSIVGFDDSEVSRITWPPITTVRQPVFEMAVVGRRHGAGPTGRRRGRHARGPSAPVDRPAVVRTAPAIATAETLSGRLMACSAADPRSGPSPPTRRRPERRLHPAAVSSVTPANGARTCGRVTAMFITPRSRPHPGVAAAPGRSAPDPRS